MCGTTKGHGCLQGVSLLRDCGSDVGAPCGAQGVLSKLSAAKELMKEILAREKKKTAEREAAKVPPLFFRSYCMDGRYRRLVPGGTCAQSITLDVRRLKALPSRH